MPHGDGELAIGVVAIAGEYRNSEISRTAICYRPLGNSLVPAHTHARARARDGLTHYYSKFAAQRSTFAKSPLFAGYLTDLRIDRA